MPLYSHALALIRANLEAIQKGRRAKPVEVGTLTNLQLEEINRHRISRNQTLHPIIAKVIFIGSHIHQSRIVRDGYTIDDVMDQIVSAMSEASELVGNLPHASD